MGRFKLLPSWFYRIHPIFRTPTRAILVFGLVGTLLAFTGNIPFVADLYNYGALISYLILMLSLIKLRNIEREVYRPWKIPGSMILSIAGRNVEIPLIGVGGLIGTLTLFILTLLLHPAGRLFGTLWLLLGLLVYAAYRRKIGLPVTASLMKDRVSPISHIYEVGLLVRPIDDPQTVVNTVLRGVDRRFRITLMSILEPRALAIDPGTINGSIQLEHMAQESLEDLEEIAKMLRKKGYEVNVRVYVGDLEKIIDAQLEGERLDFIAVIRRFTGKAKLEKVVEESSLRKIISKHPGRIMVLRRVSEVG